MSAGSDYCDMVMRDLERELAYYKAEISQALDIDPKELEPPLTRYQILVSKITDETHNSL